jgi:hypothetical protein
MSSLLYTKPLREEKNNISILSSYQHKKSQENKHLLGFLKPDKNQTKKKQETQTLGLLETTVNRVGGESRARICKPLKVPKRENFLLAFFALSEPIWVGDLGTKPKKNFF